MIIGFNFNTISVQRKRNPSGNIDIKNNVAIKDVQKADFKFGSASQQGLKFIFEFTSKYTPDFGEVLLTGEVLYLADDKTTRQILDEWASSKKISKELMSGILNTVLARCNIQAWVLSKEVNLPPPIPMPQIGKEPEKKK